MLIEIRAASNRVAIGWQRFYQRAQLWGGPLGRSRPLAGFLHSARTANPSAQRPANRQAKGRARTWANGQSPQADQWPAAAQWAAPQLCPSTLCIQVSLLLFNQSRDSIRHQSQKSPVIHRQRPVGENYAN